MVARASVEAEADPTDRACFVPCAACFCADAPVGRYAALADNFNTDPGPEWMAGGFRYERNRDGHRFQKPGLLGETPAVVGCVVPLVLVAKGGGEGEIRRFGGGGGGWGCFGLGFFGGG
jgi:hypothetical protein